MYFMSRYFDGISFETCFLVCDGTERHSAMFGEYLDGARRLGNSAGSTSEVMLAYKLTQRKLAGSLQFANWRQLFDLFCLFGCLLTFWMRPQRLNSTLRLQTAWKQLASRVVWNETKRFSSTSGLVFCSERVFGNKAVEASQSSLGAYKQPTLCEWSELACDIWVHSR